MLCRLHSFLDYPRFDLWVGPARLLLDIRVAASLFLSIIFLVIGGLQGIMFYVFSRRLAYEQRYFVVDCRNRPNENLERLGLGFSCGGSVLHHFPNLGGGAQ